MTGLSGKTVLLTGTLGSLGRRATCVSQDLADLRETKTLVRRLAEERGGIDVLVNNDGGW